jgi:hypothetical protein
VCDAQGCVRAVDAWRKGRDPRGHKVVLALCVEHRQSFDSGEVVVTAAGPIKE